MDGTGITPSASQFLFSNEAWIAFVLQEYDEKKALCGRRSLAKGFHKDQLRFLFLSREWSRADAMTLFVSASSR